MTPEYFDELYNTYFSKPAQADEPLCKCDIEYIAIKGNMLCPNCGIVDVYKIVYGESYSENSRRISGQPKLPYKRKVYFRQKLRLLGGYKQCMTDDYENIILKLSSEKFETVHELKRIMQKKKMSKFYIYIYDIYFRVKGVKLLKLSHSDITNMTRQFTDFDRWYKNEYPNKSMMSYDVISLLLLKENKINTSDIIIIPKNYKKSELIFNKYLNKISIKSQ